MRLLVVIYLLGASFNLAWAQAPESEVIISPTSVESIDESEKPNFTTLVKSTMDLLGPVEDVEEISMSQEVETQKLSVSKSE